MQHTNTPETVNRPGRQNLHIAYKTRKAMISAAKEVSFTINRGETLGIVGESGCGKSTVAYAIVNFLGSNGRITRETSCLKGRNWSDDHKKI